MTSKAIPKPRASLLGSQSLSPLAKVPVGSRVVISRRRGGWVCYVGKLAHESGEWYGVALDEPKGDGDGTWGAERYFDCAPNHGIFVRRKEIYCVVDPASSLKNPPSPVTDENSSSGSSASTDLQSGEGEAVAAVVHPSGTVATTATSLLQPFKSFRKHLNSIALKATGPSSPSADGISAAPNGGDFGASSLVASPTGKSRLKPPSPLRRFASFSQGLPHGGGTNSVKSTISEPDEKRRLSSPPASPKSSHAKQVAANRTGSFKPPPDNDKQFTAGAKLTKRTMPPSPSTSDRTQNLRTIPSNRGTADECKRDVKTPQDNGPTASSPTSAQRVDSAKASPSDAGCMKTTSSTSPDRTQSFRVLTVDTSTLNKSKPGARKFQESMLSSLSPTHERRTSSLRAPSPIHKPPTSDSTQANSAKDATPTWQRRFSSYKAPPATNRATVESNCKVSPAITAPAISPGSSASPSSTIKLSSTRSEVLEATNSRESVTPAQKTPESPPDKCASNFEAQIIDVDLRIEGGAEEARVQPMRASAVSTELVSSDRFASFKIPVTERVQVTTGKQESSPVVPLLKLPSSNSLWDRTSSFKAASSPTADAVNDQSHDVEDIKNSVDKTPSFEAQVVDLDEWLDGGSSDNLPSATEANPPASRPTAPEPAGDCAAATTTSVNVADGTREEDDVKPLLIPPEKSSPARAASFRALRIDVTDTRTRSLQIKPPSPSRVASFRSGDYVLGLLVSDTSEASPPSSPRSTTASSVDDAGDTDTQSEASAVSAPEPRARRQPPGSPRLQQELTTVESLSPSRQAGELEGSPGKRPLFFRRANVGRSTMERRSSYSSFTSAGNGASMSPPRSPTAAAGGVATRTSRVAALEKEIGAMRSSHENVVAVLRATNKQHAANVLELRAQASALSEANLWLERQLTAKSELVRELRELEQQQQRDHMSVGEVKKILELKDAQIQALEREVAQLRQKLVRLDADKDAQLEAQRRHFAARRERDEERVQDLRQEVVAMCNDRVALQSELRDLKEMTRVFF